ncbi:MAG TPA: AAA family ATPase, partial [Acidimicrobiales bacterium]
MEQSDPFGQYHDRGSSGDEFDVPSFSVESLDQALHRIELLEQKLVESRLQVTQSRSNNEKLAITIQQTRDQIAALRDEVEKLTQPPAVYGTFIEFNPDGTADIFASGRKMRVSVHPGLDPGQVERGHEVVLNESFAIIGIRNPDGQGEVVSVKEVLDDRRVLVYGRADEERVVEMADALRDVKLRSGDAVLLDPRSGLLVEKLVRQEAEELILEEVPDVSYADVGGLDSQIESITDAVELPYLHRALFNDYELPAPKGILLYGPPGCGKTLIAKAVANSLSQKVGEMTGNRNVRSYFLNIKGPELLNKYVGETERQIRVVFQRAREKAEEGVPVIVFFDEMDSLFRTRGTGISSDMESTIVPQLLAEIDGVESLRDV